MIELNRQDGTLIPATNAKEAALLTSAITVEMHESATTSETTMTIELRGGLLVLDSALRLALDLEARGHVLTAKDGALHVTNQSRLTDEDRAAIKAQRLHLMAISTYEAPI